MKNFKILIAGITLMLMALVSVGVSAAVAPTLGLSVKGMSACMFGGGIGLSLVMPTGIAPMAFSITTAYAGEVLQKLLVRATTYNEIVEGQHIRLVPGIGKKYYIPRLKVGTMLQKRVEQPTSSDSKGDITIDERVLEPVEFMAYTEFNPRAFEKFWKPYQPTGALVFRELPANVQSQLLTELAKVVDFELGGHFINGELGSTDDKLFNGILKRITDDTTVLSVTGAVPLTEANVVDNGLKPVLAKVPKALRNHKNLKIFMSIEDSDHYDAKLTSRDYKGKDETERNSAKYKGVKIVALASWPKDVIVATVASADMDTNFWAGVDFADDDEVILIDKVTNAGEKYFFKMLMKADTNTAFGEDIVLYDARVQG